MENIVNNFRIELEIIKNRRRNPSEIKLINQSISSA